MKIHSTILAAMAATILLLGACSSEPGYIPTGQSRVSNLGEAGLKITGRFGHDGSITAPESNLRKMPNQDIYFENIVGRRLANGFCEVSIATTNKSTRFNQNIQYSIHWYDEDGVEIHPENAGWNTLSLKAAETSAIHAVSPTASAASITIFVREITYTK